MSLGFRVSSRQDKDPVRYRGIGRPGLVSVQNPAMTILCCASLKCR